MVHERFDLEKWVKALPLAQFDASGYFPRALTGPLPVAYVEQIRAEVRSSGADLGREVPVDLCVWNYGDSERRDVTKVGGIPYWPASEPWPWLAEERPCTFVAQFCFADSRDILPELPGDILSILAGESYQDLDLHWFELGDEELWPAEKLPAPQWTISPCYASLHRTVEYLEADYALFDAYPYPFSIWAKKFTDGSKIGGTWELRGEMPEPEEVADPVYRRKLEESWRKVRIKEQAFLCQLGSQQATTRHPFLNIESSQDLSRAGRPSSLLMIGDVGGYDFFFDGENTEDSWWSG